MKPTTLLALAAALLLALPAAAKGKAKRAKKAAAKTAVAASRKDVTKPIKRVIGAIRYSKRALALAQFDGPKQARFLLSGHGKTFTAEESKKFIDLFHAMFANIAFPRVRKNFEKLETILYDQPQIEGSTANVGTTIVILHPAKKQEVKTTFSLALSDGVWKVVDVTLKGDKSMLSNIKAEQIGPLLKEGGKAHLFGLMSKRVAATKR